ERLVDLHERFGPDYARKLVVQEISSTLQRVVGDATYTTLTQPRTYTAALHDSVAYARTQLDTEAVEVEDVVIKQITLPAELSQAIHDKLRQQQMVELQQYRVEDERFSSYAQLRRNALALLARWNAEGAVAGDEVVLHLESSQEFVAALWACFLGKLIAVPLTAGSSPEHVRKLENVRARLRRPWIATTRAQVAESFDGRVLDATIPDDGAPLADMPETIDPTSIALVQFSSGSTGTPKGVTVTHAALRRNAADMAAHSECGPADRLLSWMPLTHDMGLV